MYIIMSCNPHGTNLAGVFQEEFPLTSHALCPQGHRDCCLPRAPKFYVCILYIHIYICRMILPREEHLEVVGKLINFGDPESHASGGG